MKMELEKIVLRQLYDGLWHTTHPDRFQSILKSGAILPEPNIPNEERWITKDGEYPYVRTLGGVSLFDFSKFDAEEYSRTYRLSSWFEFVPYRESWSCSVWIEIDRTKILSGFISGNELLTRWKAKAAHKHPLMPKIEAAHVGMIPREAFKRAFTVYAGDHQMREYKF